MQQIYVIFRLQSCFSHYETVEMLPLKVAYSNHVKSPGDKTEPEIRQALMI